MDSIFGIGLPELIFILLIAGIVMGPQRIRKTARWLGLMTVKTQRISRELIRQLNTELDAADTDGSLRSTADEMRQLKQQFAELKQEMRANTLGNLEAAKTAVNTPHENLRRIMPPDLVSKSQAPSTAPAAKPPAAPHPIPSPLTIADDPE